MHQQHPKRRQRRHHSAQFKAQLVEQSVNGVASVSAIAVDNGINPNLLRRWVLEHERLGLHTLEVEQQDRRTAVAEPGVSSVRAE
jgi:transposase-like protein